MEALPAWAVSSPGTGRREAITAWHSLGGHLREAMFTGAELARAVVSSKI